MASLNFQTQDQASVCELSWEHEAKERRPTGLGDLQLKGWEGCVTSAMPPFEGLIFLPPAAV